MSEFAAIVVGGGISGVAFARKAAERGPTLLLEAAPRLGGCLHSQRLGESGYWFELGAHTCYNSYGGLIELLESAQAMGLLRPRTKVPFRLWTEAGPASIGKALSKLPILLGLLKLPLLSKEGKTVREYYSAITGTKNYDRAVSGLLAAVPSQDADGFPAAMLFKKRPRRKDVLRSFTLEGGLQRGVEAIARHPELTVRTGATITAVAALAPADAGGAGFAVTLAGGEVIRAPAVALALPPDAAAQVTREGFPALSEALGRIAMAQVASVGVVVPADRVALEPLAGLVPSGADIFWSVVSRDVVPDSAHRGFTFHFRPDTTREQRLARVALMLGVTPDAFEMVVERSGALPAPARGHEAIVAAIDGAIAGQRLAVTGAFFAGLAIEDCVGRSLAEFQRVLGLS